MSETSSKEIVQLFGKNLRKIRRAKDITQENLAFEIGITQTQVARMEKGIVNTSISNLYLISKALNCSLDDFFKEE